MCSLAGLGMEKAMTGDAQGAMDADATSSDAQPTPGSLFRDAGQGVAEEAARCRLCIRGVHCAV